MNKGTLEDFIKNSYELLEGYHKKGRYYHSLLPTDNSPTVVHKKTNQLTYVMKGTGEFVLDGKSITLNENESISILAGTKHRIIAKSDELVLFHIHIPDEGRDSDRFIIEGDDYNRFK